MSRCHATDRLSGLDDVVRNCEGEAGVVLRRTRVPRRAADSDEGFTFIDFLLGRAPLLNSYILETFRRCERKPARGALEDFDVEPEAK